MFLNWFSNDDRKRYQTSAQKLTIDHLGSSLVNLRYADEVIRQHLHEWLRFCVYLEDSGISPLPAANSDLVQNYVTKRIEGLSDSRARFIRVSIRIFFEADENGKFPRRIKSRTSTPIWFGQILTQYLQFARVHRGMSEETERKHRQHLSSFAHYLENCGIVQLDAITPHHIREFYENTGGVPRRWHGPTLRAFFNWAAAQGWLSKTLGDAIPRPRQYRHIGLPDVLNKSDMERLLAAVDRSTALGRRDYAILLLAACYGLRPSDIRQLTLDHIDWRAARIDLRQVKTGRPLALPLLPEVATALSAYLCDGRPSSTNRVIFLRHCAPFEPFANENNLNAIMRKALRRAGLYDRSGRRGLYLLRHTLATQLLASGHPLKTISDLLGHASTQTTYIYTKVDLVGLRAVAISEEEVNQ